MVQVYSNQISGEEITFKYYNAENDEVIAYGETLSFTSNMVVGHGFEPIGLNSEMQLLPEHYSLNQAYPNPFNPTTTLSLALPMETEVFLSVYNLQGREVISLTSGNMEAGYHSVVWNADKHPSGVYFVKMVAGDFVSTQKIMLIK